MRLSHRPERSGHAAHGEVDGFDIGGQHGRRFVLLAVEEAIPHLYKQERKSATPVRTRLSRSQAVLGRAIPWGGCRCRI